ncbi:MAG: hypothetical protein AAFN05_16300 [Pseudomonadota bacterium]
MLFYFGVVRIISGIALWLSGYTHHQGTGGEDALELSFALGISFIALHLFVGPAWFRLLLILGALRMLVVEPEHFKPFSVGIVGAIMLYREAQAAHVRRNARRELTSDGTDARKLGTAGGIDDKGRPPERTP